MIEVRDSLQLTFCQEMRLKIRAITCISTITLCMVRDRRMSQNEIQVYRPRARIDLKIVFDVYWPPFAFEYFSNKGVNRWSQSY